ncbi:MAG: helix-turn-helix transcriptional regulator [Eubacteriales bacterium]|nr:helix-turn-helix transcriptional regulator [Eubacteriales bacterium]
MKNISEEMGNLRRLVEMLAAQYGKNSEIILHDLTKNYEHTIVAIENNWITGRKVGDGGTNLGLEVLRNPPSTNGDIYNYFTKTAEGRLLRSSTLYFRDDAGKVIGSLCINTDITQMVEMQETMREFTMVSQKPEIREVFADNVEDLVEFFISESKKIVDKPAVEMTREEKMEILRYLDKKGFFLITHAGSFACEYLDISKYTLYKYLGMIRAENDDGNPELSGFNE